MCQKYLAFLLLILLGSCQSKPDHSPSDPFKGNHYLDFEKISAKLVDQAALQQGERVLLVMAPGEFNALIPELAHSIKQSGAQYLGTLSVTDEAPEEWTTKFTKSCVGKNASELSVIFEEVDLGIMLPGARSWHLPYKTYQDMLEEGIRRTIHFHWAGAYDLNGSLLETTQEKGLFYQNVLLTTDYQQLAQHQQGFEEALRNKTIQVTNSEGTNLSFEIGDRPVTKQDGNASANRANQGKNLIDREVELPAGAIRVAPIEESVNGTIAFPDALWDDQPVENLIVTIEQGKIIDFSASKGKEAVEREMTKAGDAGRSFREFALGFNPLMPVQKEATPWIPYYGYGAGVVRLSLGDNTELGGKVGGGYVRWNFFPNTTVKVGEEVWVENGVLIK